MQRRGDMSLKPVHEGPLSRTPGAQSDPPGGGRSTHGKIKDSVHFRAAGISLEIMRTVGEAEQPLHPQK